MNKNLLIIALSGTLLTLSTQANPLQSCFHAIDAGDRATLHSHLRAIPLNSYILNQLIAYTHNSYQEQRKKIFILKNPQALWKMYLALLTATGSCILSTYELLKAVRTETNIQPRPGTELIIDYLREDALRKRTEAFEIAKLFGGIGAIALGYAAKVYFYDYSHNQTKNAVKLMHEVRDIEKYLRLLALEVAKREYSEMCKEDTMLKVTPDKKAE